MSREWTKRFDTLTFDLKEKNTVRLFFPKCNKHFKLKNQNKTDIIKHFNTNVKAKF